MWDAACITCFSTFSCSIETGEADRAVHRTTDAAAAVSARRTRTSSDLLVQLPLVILSLAGRCCLFCCVESSNQMRPRCMWRLCTLCGVMHARYLHVAGKRGKSDGAVVAHLGHLRLERDLSALIPPFVSQTSGALARTRRCVCGG